MDFLPRGRREKVRELDRAWRELERIGQAVAHRALALQAGLVGHDAQPALTVTTTPVYVRNENSQYDLLRSAFGKDA